MSFDSMCTVHAHVYSSQFQKTITGEIAHSHTKCDAKVPKVQDHGEKDVSQKGAGCFSRKVKPPSLLETKVARHCMSSEVSLTSATQ